MIQPILFKKAYTNLEKLFSKHRGFISENSTLSEHFGEVMEVLSQLGTGHNSGREADAKKIEQQLITIKTHVLEMGEKHQKILEQRSPTYKGSEEEKEIITHFNLVHELKKLIEDYQETILSHNSAIKKQT